MEENRKGNTLYAVLGVATLVVAIIGATFAYFSASATVTGDQITGGTSDIGNALTLNVERVLFSSSGSKDDTGAYGNLVPAEIDLKNKGTDNVANAVNSKCVANGYTGCHLYKITASSQMELKAADVLLKEFSVETTDKDAWKFVVFTGTESTDEDTSATTYSVTSLVTGTTAEDFENSTATTKAGYNLNAGKGFTADETKTYYLLVYLENLNEVQNPSETTDYKATGTYTGKVVFNAANGQVVANFNASVGK